MTNITPVISIIQDRWNLYAATSGINDGTYVVVGDQSLFYTHTIIIEGLCVYWATGGVETVTVDVDIVPGPGTKIHHQLDRYTTVNPVTAKSYYPLNIPYLVEDYTNICHLTINTSATSTTIISAWGRLIGEPLVQPTQPVTVKQIDVWPFKRRD